MSSSERNARFIELYLKAVDDAKETVLARPSRNTIISLPDMFPHGLQDIAFMLFMKSARLLGYVEKKDNYAIREEGRDIINYAGFLLAYLDKDTQTVRSNELPLDPVDDSDSNPKSS